MLVFIDTAKAGDVHLVFGTSVRLCLMRLVHVIVISHLLVKVLAKKQQTSLLGLPFCWMMDKMDKRLLLIEITMCEMCHHFKDDDCGFGSAKYSCAHPNGPGGLLSEELIKNRTIHQDCPLVKVRDS